MVNILVIGYGNPLRGDDGIGPAVAEELAEQRLPGVRVVVVHQLTPELAAELAEVRLAVFVDAASDREGVSVARLIAGATGPVMSHSADPRWLLALCAAVFSRSPEAWLVTAAGVDFGFGAGLSALGRKNAEAALREVGRLIRESGMG